MTYKTSTKKHYIKNQGVTAVCQKVAADITSKSQMLSVKDMHDLGRKDGKPSSHVMLPSGDWYENRWITGHNKHVCNNKLEVTESTITHPGMLSNLKIDFGN